MGPLVESGDCVGLGAGAGGRCRYKPVRRATPTATTTPTPTETATARLAATVGGCCLNGSACHHLPWSATGLPPSAKTCHELPRTVTIQRPISETGAWSVEAFAARGSKGSLGLGSGWGSNGHAEAIECGGFAGGENRGGTPAGPVTVCHIERHGSMRKAIAFDKLGDQVPTDFGIAERISKRHGQDDDARTGASACWSGGKNIAKGKWSPANVQWAVRK